VAINWDIRRSGDQEVGIRVSGYHGKEKTAAGLGRRFGGAGGTLESTIPSGVDYLFIPN